MVTLHEGLGGLSIIAQNGDQSTRIDGFDFLICDENGINWIDLDQAMQAADLLNQQQQTGAINDSTN